MKIKETKGFSFVEMAVIIAIIIVLTTLAAPSFTRSSQNRNLQTAARSIAADINYLRQRAMAESTPYTLNFLSNTTYSYALPNLPNPPLNVTKNITDVCSGLTYTTNFEGAALTIQPRGSFSNLGTITVIHPNGSKVTIAASITGRINVTPIL